MLPQRLPGRGILYGSCSWLADQPPIQISDQRDGVNQTTLLHAEHILLVDELGFRLRLVRENAQLATAAP
jgi:hypothetical protein